MLIPKDGWGCKIFWEFAGAAGLGVDSGSVSTGVPPQPDIRFTVSGVERWAELVEITDQDLARNHVKSLKTGAITGGAFSQRVPLERSIWSKARNPTRRAGSRLDLLAYYDKQFPAISIEPDLIPEAIGQVATEMVASGVWTRVWVYDTWSKTILWAYPGDAASSREAGQHPPGADLPPIVPCDYVAEARGPGGNVMRREPA